jgi:signal transduction histidine kinase
MRKSLQHFFKPDISSSAIAVEWKLATFRTTLAYGLIPLTMLILIGFLAFGVWKMVIVVSGLLLAFLLSLWMAGLKKLGASVNIAIAGPTIVNFYYLLYLQNTDGLYFTVFMIIIAGIFLDIRAAFGWAVIQTCLLALAARISPNYSVFPVFSQYFNQQNMPDYSQKTFVTAIFLYIVSAFLSILFQGYFVDLLKKVKESHDEKVMLETQMLQSQKLESIGLLVSGIAHDFGKGLSSIKSSANLILNKFKGNSDELARYAQNIYNSCNMISDSSTRLLAFARKSTDEMTFLNMHDVIESMTNLLAFMLGSKIKITKDFQARESTITGNFSQLQSVLMNLAVNASDAMPKGGALAFSTKNRGPAAAAKAIPPGGYLEIKVSDSGIGMDDSIKEKIFTPFFTTKAPDKGTGLGLSNVRRIVHAHNGSIEVSSEKEKGTTFTIHLPLAAKPGSMKPE